MAAMVVAEARGSISVMCRAEVPDASRERDGSAVSERRECCVERVETGVPVGRSHVRREWSHEAE